MLITNNSNFLIELLFDNEIYQQHSSNCLSHYDYFWVYMINFNIITSIFSQFIFLIFIMNFLLVEYKYNKIIKSEIKMLHNEKNEKIIETRNENISETKMDEI